MAFSELHGREAFMVLGPGVGFDFEKVIDALSGPVHGRGVKRCVAKVVLDGDVGPVLDKETEERTVVSSGTDVERGHTGLILGVDIGVVFDEGLHRVETIV